MPAVRRVYDKIGDTAEATIAYVTPKGCVCELVLENAENNNPATSETTPEAE